MQDDYFTSDTSDKMLEHALSEGISLEDPENETTSEVFLRTTAVQEGMISKDQLLECLDSQKFEGVLHSLAVEFSKRKYVRDRQLGNLLKLYKESLSGEGEKDLLADLAFGLDAAEKKQVTYAEVWGALNLQEREKNKGLGRRLKEILARRQALTGTAGTISPEMADAMADLDARFIGKRIGPCEVIEKIGEGGMGAVYRARHITLSKMVAVKIMTPALISEVHKQRFLREARAAASLEHPNVVVVHDAGEEDGYSYIVMQLIEGKSVGEVLKEEGRFSSEQALLIIEGAAKGLEAAHAKKLIHRDLKPDNIMITGTGEIKVTDFGLAKGEMELPEADTEGGEASPDMAVTAAGTVLGTPSYMSPEQFEGERLDARSDIYSLGATFYHMLAGRPPFVGDTFTELMEMHRKAPPPPLDSLADNIPPEVCRIVYRMMEKNPDERYPDVTELIADMRKVFLAFAEREALAKYMFVPELPKPVRPAPESAPQFIPVEPSRKTALWIAAVSAVVVVLIVIAVSILMSVFNNVKPATAEKTDKKKKEEMKQLVDETLKEREAERRRKQSEDRAKIVMEGIKVLARTIDDRIVEYAAENDWDSTKLEAAKAVFSEHVKSIEKVFSQDFQSENSSDDWRERAKNLQEMLGDTRTKLLEHMTPEEADEFLREIPDFRRMMFPPRGGRWGRSDRRGHARPPGMHRENRPEGIQKNGEEKTDFPKTKEEK